MIPILFAATIVTSLGAAPARASAGDAELREIDEVLATDAATSRRWYFGWLVGFGVATAAQLALVRGVNDEGRRADLRVGAFMSGLGFVTTATLPPPSIFYDRPSRLDEETLRSRLRRSATTESLGHSWLLHALGIAANAGAGLYLALHYQRPWSGLLQFVGGSVVSSVKIALLPSDARDYRRSNSTHASLTPLVGVGLLGLAVDASF